MFSALWPLIGLAALAHAADDKLVLRDPTFYPILSVPGAKLECRCAGPQGYGLNLERRQGNTVHVTVVTDGKPEGEKSAFDVALQEVGLKRTYLRAVEREGTITTVIEVIIESRTSPNVGYQLPGRFMITDMSASKEPAGQELPRLEPAAIESLACRPPAPTK